MSNQRSLWAAVTAFTALGAVNGLVDAWAFNSMWLLLIVPVLFLIVGILAGPVNYHIQMRYLSDKDKW